MCVCVCVCVTVTVCGGHLLQLGIQMNCIARSVTDTPPPLVPCLPPFLLRVHYLLLIQIVTYLRQHASPHIAARTPLVPEVRARNECPLAPTPAAPEAPTLLLVPRSSCSSCSCYLLLLLLLVLPTRCTLALRGPMQVVADQIQLWENEQNRYRIKDACYFSSFDNKEIFDKSCKYAHETGVWLWQNSTKRQLVRRPRGSLNVIGDSRAWNFAVSDTSAAPLCELLSSSPDSCGTHHGFFASSGDNIGVLRVNEEGASTPACGYCYLTSTSPLPFAVSFDE